MAAKRALKNSNGIVEPAEAHARKEKYPQNRRRSRPIAAQIAAQCSCGVKSDEGAFQQSSVSAIAGIGSVLRLPSNLA